MTVANVQYDNSLRIQCYSVQVPTTCRISVHRHLYYKFSSRLICWRRCYWSLDAGVGSESVPVYGRFLCPAQGWAYLKYDGVGQLVVRQRITFPSDLLRNLNNNKVEIVPELLTPHFDAFDGYEHRGLEGFHERGRQEAAFYRPENPCPVDGIQITDRETLIWINITRNVGLKRHSLDVFTSRFNLTNVKSRNKSDLETLAGGIYPLTAFSTKARPWFPIKVTEFLTVANGVFCLASTVIHSSQTLAIPATVSAVRTVTGSWKNHWRLWKWLVGVTKTVIIDWALGNTIPFNHTLVVAMRSVSTLVFTFRTLSDVGVGKACSTLVFGVDC